MRGDGLAAKAAAVIRTWDSEPGDLSAAMDQALYELSYALSAHRGAGLDRINRHRRLQRERIATCDQCGRSDDHHHPIEIAPPLDGIEQYQAEDR
jgi:hypothetical protein